MVFQLLAGMLIGAVLASAVWGFLIKTGKSRSEALQRERDDIMHSIGEVWVEIDSLLSSYKCGVVDDKGFHEAFTSKIEIINQQLKPNMHLFDVYYVKYQENQIEQYKKTAHYTGMAQPITKGTAADHELETSYTVVGHHETREKSEDAGTTEESALSLEVEHAMEPGDAESTIDSPEAVIEEMVDAGILSDAKGENEGTVSEQSEAEIIAGETDAEKTVIPEEPEETDTLVTEGQPEDKVAEVEMPVEHAAAPSTETVQEEKKPPKVPEEEQPSDDGMFDVVIAEEEKNDELSLEAVGGTSAEADAEKKSETETASAEEVKKTESVVASKTDIESEFFGDEDFTMETLMDVDINTISPYMETQKTSPDKEEEQNTEEKTGKKMDDDLEVVIASNASHSDHSSEDSGNDSEPVRKVTASILDNDDDIPEETTYTPVGELEKRSADTEKTEDQFSEAEEFEVTIAEDADESESTPAASQTEEENVEQEEMTFFESELVTGDDVADTIAALERKPINPKPETTEKKPEKKKSKTTKSKKKKKEPVAVAEKKVPTDEKKKDGEESITGDDVVDQIDEFFGLIE